MKTQNNTNKILFLCDLERFSSNHFKNTLNLAKTLDAEIELFYVKKPTKIAKSDNQLSVIRTMNRDFSETTKSIENILSSYSESVQKNTNYSIAYGNVKSEVEKRIDSYQPDIIILGKRKRKQLHFLGDSLTEFVIKKHEGDIIIATPESEINPEEHLSFGIYNTDETRFEKTMLRQLFSKSKHPLKVFKSSVVSDGTEHHSLNIDSDLKKVEFVFEHSDSYLNNLSKYISLNNINLLCLERNAIKKNSRKNSGVVEMRNLVDNLNVSLWISNQPNYLTS